MTSNSPTDDGCTLCDLPVEGSDVVLNGERFCCVGCRDVYEALDDVADVDAEDVRAGRTGTDEDDRDHEPHPAM